MRENDVRNKHVQVLYESVRVSGTNEVKWPENLMDIGNGLINDNVRVSVNERTVHAGVQAISPSA